MSVYHCNIFAFPILEVGRWVSSIDPCKYFRIIGIVFNLQSPVLLDRSSALVQISARLYTYRRLSGWTHLGLAGTLG